MIPFNGVLVEECWGPLPVLPSGQRQVAGREPLSERRSVEQPGYLGESLLHLRHHPAPITATRHMGTVTQTTDIPPIGIVLTGILAMDTQPTHSRAMDIQAIRVVPVTSLPRPMDTTVTRGTPLIPVPLAMDHLATWDTRVTPARRATNTTATRNTRLTLTHPVMDHPATRDRLLTPVPRATDI